MIAALPQQRWRRFDIDRVERGVQCPFALERLPAEGALIEMRFDLLFVIKRKFTIQEQRELSAQPITLRHTKSPKAARIFCVARNRQFFAASSDVPKTSPIFLSRKP